MNNYRTATDEQKRQHNALCAKWRQIRIEEGVCPSCSDGLLKEGELRCLACRRKASEYYYDRKREHEKVYA